MRARGRAAKFATMRRSSLLIAVVPFLFAGCAAVAPAPLRLFDGASLNGWHADVPAADGGADVPPSFVVRDGLLVSQGKPEGHLITDASFRDYRLVIEWRWPGEPGNCGVLVHSSTPRRSTGCSRSRSVPAPRRQRRRL